MRKCSCEKESFKRASTDYERNPGVRWIRKTSGGHLEIGSARIEDGPGWGRSVWGGWEKGWYYSICKSVWIALNPRDWTCSFVKLYFINSTFVFLVLCKQVMFSLFIFEIEKC